jgi:tetratricopeptide (TPR) repeat protein
MNRTRKLFAALLAAVATASAGAQLLQYPSVEFWQNPENQKAFLASYGVNPQVEPKLSTEEQVLFKTILEQLKLDGGRAVATQTLTAAIKPESSAALDFTLANLKAEGGQIDEAILHYRNAVKKEPNFLRAHKNLGLFLCQKGDFENAIPSLTKAVNLGAADSVTYGLLGLSYLNTGKILAAEAAYRMAVVFDPATNDWKLGLARSLIEQGKYTEGVAMLDEILKGKPEETSLWLAQANAFLGLNQPKKAAANFEILRRMGKASPESLLLLGDIYMNESMRDLALEAYLDALERDPNQPVDRLVRAAEILVSSGALDQADVLLAQINNNYTGKLQPREELLVLKLQSRIAIAKNESDKAAEILEQVVDRSPLDGEALILLANHYNRKDNVERASLFYERAGKINEFEPDALVAWAQMLVGKSRYNEALPKLERAQTLKPRENVGRYLQQVRNAAQMSSGF